MCAGGGYGMVRCDEGAVCLIYKGGGLRVWGKGEKVFV